MNTLQIRRAAQAQQRVLRVCGAAQQDDRVALVLEPLSGDVIGPFNEADHRDRWGGVDRAVWTLIIETDVAAGDGRVESATSLGQAAHGFAQLPEGLRVVGIAEIEIVGRAERRGSSASQISRRLCDGDFSAFVRVEIDVGGVAINGKGEEFFGRDA